MAITNRDGLIDALGNNSQSLVISKASISSQVAGGFSSLWRATGIPAQGAIPTTAAFPDNTTIGCFTYTNAVTPVRTYLARLFMVSSNSGTDVQMHDRMAHMGGLVGNVTTAQTVGVDASNASLIDRRGDANYSDCQWWLEWYTATGATVATATVNVTYNDGTTGNTTVALTATMGASRLLPIQSAVNGKFIKTVNTVTLSVSTGTAGNFGVTVTRALGGLSLGLANAGEVGDWAYLGLPRIIESACLAMIMVPGSTSTGTLYGSGKLVQG